MAKNELGNPGPPPLTEVAEIMKAFRSGGQKAGVAKKKEVDALGRVDGKTYPSETPLEDIPEVIRAAPADRKIKIFRDTTLEYPVLCLKIFIMPDPSVHDDEARFAKMFARSGCRKADSVQDADLVVFGGGSDVDPVLYGQSRHETTYPNPKRDSSDMDVFLECQENGIPMFGVCRGAQFLHVMNGGQLFQDVDGHYGDHSMFDLKQKKKIERISSVHHQACRPNPDGGMEILATSACSETRALNAEVKHSGPYPDIEAFFYRDTCSIGVQGHPEYEGYHYFTKWCLDLVLEHVSENPDLYWEGPNLRLKKEFLEERRMLISSAKETTREILKVPAPKEK